MWVRFRRWCKRVRMPAFVLGHRGLKRLQRVLLHAVERRAQVALLRVEQEARTLAAERIEARGASMREPDRLAVGRLVRQEQA